MRTYQQQAENTIKRCIQLIKKDWNNRGKEYFTEEVCRDSISQPYLFSGIPPSIWREELNSQLMAEFLPEQMKLGIKY